MPVKIKGAGTLFQARISGTYTTIGQRTSISGPELSISTLEVTDLDSLAREYRPLLPDSGKITMKAWYDPNDSTMTTLQGWVLAPAVQQWKLVFNSSPARNATFDGFLTKFNLSGMEVDGYVEVDIEIQITGNVVFA